MSIMPGLYTKTLLLVLLSFLLAQTRAATVWATELTFTIQPSAEDTFVNSMYLHTKYLEDPHGYLWAIFAGNMYVEYDSYKLYGSSRIYIKFNITSIPKDAKVLSANMCLCMFDPPKTAQEFETYRVLSNWDQHKLTWRTQPPVAGIPTSTAMINPTPTGTWVCWEITSDLKMWHLEPTKNYGMIKIKHEMNASDQLASFYPKESTQPQGLKPKLIVRVDWHKPIDSTPSPTPSPTETSMPATPSTSPIETPPQTSPYPPPSVTPPQTSTNTLENLQPGHQQTNNAQMATMILVLLVVTGGAVLVLRRNRKRSVSPKKNVVSRRAKKPTASA